MNLSLSGNYLFARNKAGQEVTVEYTCSGDVHSEQDDCTKDWCGLYVDHMAIEDICIWIGSNTHEFRLASSYILCRILGKEWVYKLMCDAHEKLTEKASQNLNN